ncbi:non-specific serine/threonine protein kinase [Malassezia sp. CBS 17886]|nr:non-specific serine/threonine protein kinase [Malassezia sp. CBS 17886]
MASVPVMGSHAAPAPASLAPFQGHRELAPGMRVKIGGHVVTVQRFLSQGGFARVYLVQADEAVMVPGHAYPHTQLVLKHMCVWSKEALATVRAEVDHHRELKGHRSVVHFVEASAATLAGHGWEIFILMECCSGGGLIDFLNTRLGDRLQETEVLAIFADVCEAVQVMHRAQLVHRDLKIENVLLSTNPRRFKLCDFGSCFRPAPAALPRGDAELRQLEAELNMHTTMQYRAPEMVDLRLQRPIDASADIWALGVFLYKLCYYTTPFEGRGGGPSAILAARYELPSAPVYSPEMRALIAVLLQPNQRRRPSIDQVASRVASMREGGDSGGKHSARDARPPAGASRPSSARDQRTPRSAPTQATASCPPSPGRLSLPARAAVPTRSAAEVVPPQAATAPLNDARLRFPSVKEMEIKERLAPERCARGAAASPSKLPAEAKRRPSPSHAAVSLDSSSSDEDNSPEEADPVPGFRIRALRRLSDLLAAHDDGHADTSTESQPDAEELASIEQHEKALRG